MELVLITIQFYPTSLEREGHPVRPTPTSTGKDKDPLGLDGLFDALGDTANLPNELLSEFLPGWDKNYPVTVPVSAYKPASADTTTSATKPQTEPETSETSTAEAPSQNVPEATTATSQTSSQAPSTTSVTQSSSSSSASQAQPSSSASLTTTASQTTQAENSITSSVVQGKTFIG